MKTRKGIKNSIGKKAEKILRLKALHVVDEIKELRAFEFLKAELSY
jgi:hypothetical protein